MKALVTGADGFVGRHFVELLSIRGFAVTGIDLETGTDAKDFFRESDTQFDLIVHCAYAVGGRQVIDSLGPEILENLQLDAAAFDFALRTQAKAFLYFSSSAAYPIRLQTGEIPHRLRESDCSPVVNRTDASWLRHPEPDADYGWAKLTGERLAIRARAAGLRVHVVRPFSGYAEDQSLDYPFTSLMERAYTGERYIWGPPEQARDWIHIEDVVEGAYEVYKQNIQEPINLCTGKATTMASLYRMAYYKFHDHQIEEKDIKFDLEKPTGVLYRVGNPEKFFQIYRPRITLRRGVDRAIATF